jgi:hypothetical protein
LASRIKLNLKMENKEQEIDLVELSKKMMVGFYHYCIRRAKLLAIFTISGLILGIVLYFKDKDKYQTTIIATTDLSKPLYIVDIINSLNDINRDKNSITKVLNINAEEADNFDQIVADTLDSDSTIQIKIKFNKDMVLPNLSNKLVNYVDSNLYIKQECQYAKQRGIDLINKYNLEISKLDSLQNKILETGVQNSGGSLGNLLVMNDKVNNFFHKDIIDLENKKQVEIRKMNRGVGLLIIDEKSGAKIKGVSLFGTAAKMAGILFVLGFFISLILEFIRKVKLMERSK